MPDIKATIAGNVRAELARAGISGRRLAIELGWGRVQVSDRLAGDVAFRADELVTIAEHLGLPVGRFYEGTEREPNGDDEPASPRPQSRDAVA